jgi:Fe-Mn family superoxide dismutase
MPHRHLLLPRRRPDTITALAALALALTLLGCGTDARQTALVQPPLPYAEDALEPHLSEEALRLHYQGHQAAYVARANELLKGSDLAGRSPEEILQRAAGKEALSDLYNNVAQAWNHAFFWQCLKPEGGGEPTGELAEKIEEDFGGLDAFKEAFAEVARRRFGSGWAWLVLDDGKLRVVSTANAHTPLAEGVQPLFTVDLWEHAYYLDYRNQRAEYVSVVLERLANWDFVAVRLATAGKAS